MRLTGQMCCMGKLLSETVEKKFTKGDVIKRIMKDHKACFGALLETKREKLRRLKLEKKGTINGIVPSTENSEMAWMLRTSNNRLRIVKLYCNSELSESTLLTPEKKILLREKTKDKELVRFQTRRIRKIPAKAANYDILPPVVITDNSETESEINTEIEVPKESKQKTKKPPTIPVTNANNLLEPKVQNPVKNVNSSILLPIASIKNIIDTPMYSNHVKELASKKHSKILSISPLDTKDYYNLPSVTNILNATMSENSKKMLDLWMARMIQKMGQEGFDKYKRDLIINGQMLHSAIEGTLRKKSVDVPENLKLCYNSVKIVLDQIERVKVIESQVVHPILGYRGVVDCVATYRRNLYLIDWKKSDKTKNLLSSTYDAPLQLASYIGALNADNNYPFQIKKGLLVIAYTEGDRPRVLKLQQKELWYYWGQWLRRLTKYYEMLNTRSI